MPPLPGFLRTDGAPGDRPEWSLVQILGALGPEPRARSAEAAPFRVARVRPAARPGRPTGPPRPTPHGAAPPPR